MSLRRLLKLAAAVCLAATMTFSGYAGGISYAASDRPYFLAATYCSDEWVITFWNSESADMDRGGRLQLHYPGGAVAGVPAVHGAGAV